jgi:hypothetical protein
MAMSELWNHRLNRLNYDLNGDIEVDGKFIKSCRESWTGRSNQFEPRLLCYQPFGDERPLVFKTNGLCILPIKNGNYLITKKNIYKSLDYENIEPVLIQRDMSSVVLSIGDSETSCIDNMRYSGVFERPELLNEPITHGPLLNGRHRITTDIVLGGEQIHISGVQFETDSCYESANKILIIEGKSEKAPIDSFNIRQLYFPMREISRMNTANKEIVCVFVHNYNGNIHVWKYSFSNITHMDSIVLDGHYVYKFTPMNI